MKWQQYVIPTLLQQDERRRQNYLDIHGPASTVCSVQQRNKKNLASNKVEVDKRLTEVNLCLPHVHTCMHIDTDAQLNNFLIKEEEQR